MRYRIGPKFWGLLVTWTYYSGLIIEFLLLTSLDLSVAPGAFVMNNWIMALIITAKAGTVLFFTLSLRRLRRVGPLGGQ